MQNKCSVEGCERKRDARGYCPTHYWRWRRNGTPGGSDTARPARICTAEGCKRKHYGLGYCSFHHKRHVFGRPFDMPARKYSQGTTLAERFWSLVDKSAGQGPYGECWEWKGSRQRAGYGQIKVEKTSWGAHVLSFFLSRGYKAKETVRHSCDNPPCVNPDHLLEGSTADNMRDKVERRRHAYGEKHGAAQISEIQASKIKRLLKTRVNSRVVANQMQVSVHIVRNIRKGKTWRHV